MQTATQAPEFFVEGETVSHEVVQQRLGFKTVRATKEFLDAFDIPYTPAGRYWWIDSGDVRAALKATAKPHSEHQRERDASKERKPATTKAGA